MARPSSIRTTRKASLIASEGENTEHIELKRKVLFEENKTSVGLRSRLESFVEAERRRSLRGEDMAAVRNIEVLSNITDRECAREQRIEQEPEGFQARKLRHEKMIEFATPFAGFVAQLASRKLSAEYTKERSLEQPAKLLKPYYVSNESWKRAGAHINKIMRNRLKQSYEIGNKKPPKSTRFKGSGNPAGRPKRPTQWARIRASLDAPARVKTAACAEASLDQREVVFRALCRNAISGNPAARRELMRTLKDLNRRRLLSAPKIKRRLKRLKLTADQQNQFLEVLKMCFDRTLKDMRNDYERFLSLRDRALDQEDLTACGREDQTKIVSITSSAIRKCSRKGKTNAI